ncbi:MAG: ankyrin repeat domain-containing protein [Flavobacteriaceae bacterium]|nr:ankyrin repeat domain-containing protein [Flavobacteriaceae bacterium]
MIKKQISRSYAKFAFLVSLLLLAVACQQDKFENDELIEAVKTNQLEVLKNHPEAVKALLKNASEENENALHIALKNQDYALAEWLIESGAAINIPNQEGVTPVEIAKELQNKSLIETLRKKRYEQWQKAENKFDDLALSMAIEEDNPLIVQVFLEEKIDVNYIYEDSAIPILVQAVFDESPECFELILNAGANPDTRFDTRPVITITAMLGEYDMTKQLITKGADLNDQDGPLSTALMFAAEEGYTDIVRLLLQNNADTTLKDINDEDALTKAQKNNHLEIVQLLNNKP